MPDTFESGRRGSNSRPSAWKADALSTELLPLTASARQKQADTRELRKPKLRGRRWIRTTEGINQQIYSLPHLATLVFSRYFSTTLFKTSPQSPLQKRADGGIRTPDQLITNQLLWPTELHRRSFGVTKLAIIFYCTKHCRTKKRRYHKMQRTYLHIATTTYCVYKIFHRSGGQFARKSTILFQNKKYTDNFLLQLCRFCLPMQRTFTILSASPQRHIHQYPFLYIRVVVPDYCKT